MKQSEPVEIRVNLDYIANVETGLTLFEVVQEVEEDGVSFDKVYYEDSFYVTAGTENEIDYSFYLVISSEDIQDAKAVRLDITDLDDLTSNGKMYTISIPLIVKGSGNDNGSNDDSNSDDSNDDVSNDDVSNDDVSNDEGNNDREELIGRARSSGGGCNAGITFCSVALLAVILSLSSKRKSR